MEILSPAGSFDALTAAVNYGADAVYVGGNRFSARKNAQNFTDQELEQAADYCHLRGAKLYLCCNTLMKERELSSALDFIRYAYEIGVDALIIQDLGLLSCVREALPDFPVHASTQMTVTNRDGVTFLENLGVKRVVLARELSANEIREVCQTTKTEIEVFVHGALCISYSGQCLMSSLLGGRSGNRGSCAQPCRLPYTLLENGKPVSEHLPLLCPKDLCLAHRVDDLADMGVTSLKIEGRMKSPEYVAMATHIYKQALSSPISEADIRAMLRFFSRGGSCEGYYNGCLYKDMMDFDASPKISETLPSFEEKKKKMPVSLFLQAESGKPLYLVMTDERGVTEEAYGALCQKAHTRPVTEERLREQIEKLGETSFCAAQTDILMSEDAAVSVKDLNALRRMVSEALEKTLRGRFKRQPVISSAPDRERNREPGSLSLTVEVQTEAQLRAAAESGIRRVYIPEELWHLMDLVPEPIFLIPSLGKERIGEKNEALDSLCLQNIGQLDRYKGKKLYGGHRLNVTNSETVFALRRAGLLCVTLSPELNLGALEELCRNSSGALEVIAYGRLPLMLMENCIIKSAHRCGCASSEFALRDRKQAVFPLKPRRCGTVLYNSKPIFMADRMADLKALGLDSLRLLMTVEDFDSCKATIQAYQRALSGETVSPPEDFTRGHFYRGMQ